MVPIRDIGGVRCCRGLDAFLGCFAIGFFLPLLATVALVIKAAGNGPVLRRRVRVCRNGRWIRTFEFRVAANRGPGVPRVDRFLRRARIDTLPQIFNVVRGELTFIGTDRPGFLT
jgi:lipopolysaccharide/colanic/teichoic acid biosynthesis glycosyltransferase